MICDLQKASMWKRISAYIFDVILIGIVIVGVAFFMSIFLDYDSYSDNLSALYNKYETEYSVDFDITSSEYNALSDEQVATYEEALLALSADSEVNRTYSMMINLTLIIIVFSVLISYLIFEFIVPIILGNGQTVGKKIFGIGVVRKDCVRINNLLLFVRTVLGKYTVETMIPVFIIIMFFFGSVGITGTVIIFALLLAQIISLAVTKENLALHDLLSQTVTVDMASQMIFDSPEAMIEYKKKLHAEEVEHAEYK